MGKYKRLLSDSFIYLCGSIGSKIVSLIMVSFYTYQFTTSEYGQIDISLTTISLMIPVLTLCVQDAVLSFVLDSDESDKSIVSNSFAIYLCSSAIVSLAAFAYAYFFGDHSVVAWIVAIAFAEGLVLILQRYCRAIGKNKLYASSGILSALSLALLNYLFLARFRLGINGYYLSLILSHLISIAFLSIGSKFFGKIRVGELNFKLSKKLVTFSVPLIPDSLMWWAMNALDKYFVLFMLGPSYNGLYSVAGKIPALVTTFSNLFIQAWQVSAISEGNSSDKDSFFSEVFDALLFSLAFIVSAIFIVLRFGLTYLISSSYENVFFYVPFLLFGSIFTCISGFLGANYLASKKTVGAFSSSCVGLVVNIVCNYFLIGWFGLNGAAIATAVSLFSVCVVRIINSKKFVKIKVYPKKIVVYLLVFVTETVCLYKGSMLMSMLVSLLGTVAIVLINGRYIKLVGNGIRKKIRGGKNA